MAKVIGHTDITSSTVSSVLSSGTTAYWNNSKPSPTEPGIQVIDKREGYKSVLSGTIIKVTVTKDGNGVKVILDTGYEVDLAVKPIIEALTEDKLKK